MAERNLQTPNIERREGTASPAPDDERTGRARGDGGQTGIHRAEYFDGHTASSQNGHEGTSGRSPVTLMRQLVADAAALFRKEAALAAAEVNQSVHGLTTALGSMVSGGAILHAGIILLLAAAAVGLAEVMALWLATLLVGGVVTVIGIIMLQAGKKKLEPAGLKPERTVDSLRKDKDALRRHTP